MSFAAEWFRAAYIDAGGSRNSARSYLTYLNRADQLSGGIDERTTSEGSDRLVDWLQRQATSAFGGRKNRSDCLSAVRRLFALKRSSSLMVSVDIAVAPPAAEEVTQLFKDIKALGARYYRATGRPLGVTGEVAELAAADLLGVQLAPARYPNLDGWLDREGVRLRVQIKGRAVDRHRRYVGRCPSIKAGDLFDIALLVIIDRTTMEPLEIWEADEADIIKKLAHPGSKARNERNSLGIAQFKGAGLSGAMAGRLVWSQERNGGERDGDQPNLASPKSSRAL